MCSPRQSKRVSEQPPNRARNRCDDDEHSVVHVAHVAHVMRVRICPCVAVYRFAQLTGDAKSLSVTDVQILALSYQLEKQHNGMHFLKTQPRRGKAMDVMAAIPAGATAASVVAASKAALATATPTTADSTTAAAADAVAPAVAVVAAAPVVATEPAATDAAAPAAAEEPQHEEHESDDDEEEEDKGEEAKSADVAAPAPAATATTAAAAEDDESGEGAWITPANFHKHRSAAAANAVLEIESGVACITTDYAMQNVLLQLGARLLNLRGRSIRSIRSWMKKCHACDALSSQMEREFCDSCGNHTMLRVNVTVNREGRVRFWHGTRHLNLRGTIYSIPHPKAGRHANNLKLSEDVVDERIRKGAGVGGGHADANSKHGKTPNQMFQDSIEFGLGRTGPNTNQQVFGYGRRNPNAHSGHAQKKKAGKK